jgi:cell division protein FtsB
VNENRSKTGRKWVVRFLLLFLLWLAYHGVASLLSILELNRTKAGLTTEIHRLRAKETVLESRRAFLDSDSGISILARTRLGMQREGETMYKVDVIQGAGERRVGP